VNRHIAKAASFQSLTHAKFVSAKGENEASYFFKKEWNSGFVLLVHASASLSFDLSVGL